VNGFPGNSTEHLDYKLSLTLLHASCQSFAGVAGYNGNQALSDNRTGIILLINKVNGDSCDTFVIMAHLSVCQTKPASSTSRLRRDDGHAILMQSCS
jgi:hypothetical protein